MGLPITLGRNFRKGRKVYDTHTAPHTWRSPIWSQTHTYTHTFNRLHYQSQRGDGQERILMIFFRFFFGHQSQIQQVNAIQKMYKIDVRALVKTLYSQVSFAVQRMKWKSFMNISQECLCNFCKGIGSCARLTQIYTNTLLYACELELPTDRAVGFTIPADSTPFTILSNLAYDVLCVGQRMDAVFPVGHILPSPTVYG